MNFTLRKKNVKKSGASSNELAFRLLKKRISKIKRSLFFLAIILVCSSFNVQQVRTYSCGPIIEAKVPDLTPENVFIELERQGVQHPEIVLRQSILETGWYECSKCSLEHNNIFGFRYNKKYLKFDSWIDGVKYYKKWQDKKYKGGDYYKFLKNVGYATSQTYISKLKMVKIDFLNQD